MAECGRRGGAGVADELEVPSQDFEGGGGDLINEDVTALHDAWVTESVSPSCCRSSATSWRT